jgi:8-oxo-dGTP pyrophosphatase MutT (NUDIX family)
MATRNYHRVGIIPFEVKNDLVAIMFVTSQTRGRWIFPKGKQAPEESHIQTCLREGFEEGGVRGVVLDSFPITVVITKRSGSEKFNMPVTYYPFLVTEQVDDWPEAEKRERHWVLLGDASRVAFKEDILLLVEQFKELLPWIKEDAESYRP